MEILQHWIANKHRNGDSHFEWSKPEDGAKLARIPLGTPESVDAAVAAARNALPVWRRTSLKERARYVTAMADWLVERYGEAGEETPLKRLIMDEVGKPLPEADIEVIETSDFLRFFADVAPTVLAEIEPSLDQNLWATKRALVSNEPVGVVAIIKPWNYPLEMIAWSLGPALVAGNTCVLKPSERSSLTAATFADMTRDVGLPPGVLNIVYGDATTGQALASHPGVNLVSFTGSLRGGRSVARACAERLARASLELSGNDAAIVLADADLDLAANGLVWGAFCNAGQVCVGIKRAYIASSVYDELLEKVVATTASLRPGVDYGPIIAENQVRAIEAMVSDATGHGAQVITGGKRGAKSSYFEPTILTDLSPSARILQEECFGPVLPMIAVGSEDEAIRLANDSDYGLGASVWTRDLERGQTIARQLEVGMVWINDVNVALPQAPWAGIRQSGMGFELSGDSILEYTTKKHINIETSTETRRAWWYPYG
jgi:acyl-CoA reductase-like NAD-dependent aldehyde dehydrogenase